MTTTHQGPRDTQQESCGDCPIVNSRRGFLRDIALAAVAALGAIALNKPTLALAETIEEIEPLRSSLFERSYAMPRADSVSVDAANDVILARWENRVYAFSLKCPHKGARLEWRAPEQRVFCPKHKARFLADGSHVSGRGKRDLDRYDVRIGGNGIVVNLGRLYRQDTDPAGWKSAVVAL